MKNKYKPGDGWKLVAPPVYENSQGVRIHLLGLCRLADHTFVNADLEAMRFIRVNGGNRRRGLMAWAKSLLEGRDELIG